jgi:uncharacterized protein
MKKRTRLAGVLWALALAGCVSMTFNVYFPEAAIESAAEQIEDDIRGIKERAEEVEPEQDKQSRAVFPLFIQPAYAAVDLEIDTPKIKKITESRKKRFPKVDILLTDGFAGESNNGYLKEKDRKVYNIKKLAAARKLMKQENLDRKGLFLAIAEANKISKDKVKEIEKKFAQVIRTKLKPGQYYEDDKGKWIKVEKKKKK